MWNLSGMFGESYEASVIGEAEGGPELPAASQWCEMSEN